VPNLFLNVLLPKALYSFIFSSIGSACPAHLIQVKEDEMGRACSTHWIENEYIQGFGGKGRRKKTTRKT
jgi:hypothetical protein